MQNVSVDTSKVVQVSIHAMKSKQGKAKPKYSSDKVTTGRGFGSRTGNTACY